MKGQGEIVAMCRKAKAASGLLARADTKTKNAVLEEMSRALIDEKGYILRENAKDLARAKALSLSRAMIDRLRLDDARIASMAESAAQIALREDPVGEITELRKRPNGLLIGKMRVPIGVILIIYESRPNVTSDCVALCLKSGNSVILRGGSEAINSNRAIYRVLYKAARRLGEGAVSLVTDPDKRIVKTLLHQSASIDLVIPRGGESLIEEVARESRIPVIKHYKGVCHTYVDERCGLDMAEKICMNAKVQRPGVCNAMETMLVHRAIAKKFLPKIAKRLKGAGVQIRGCAATRGILKGRGIRAATEDDWYAEYLDLILAVRVVDSLDEAISHIARYGSQHSDAIVTEDYGNALRFLKEVDSACVYVNASTRFTDGNQFGKGAEIGISTDKLHARGPMGLEELTSYKYVVFGNGQIRE